MQYMMKGADGKEYGPADVSTLRTWASEGRLAPHTTLRDFNTGQTLAASAVPGLFESAAGPGAPPIPTGYPRATGAPVASGKDPGTGMFIGVVLRSVGAVVLFFLFHGIGVFFAAYAMFYAVQCQQRGSKYGIPALIVAGIALAAVGIGWAMRLSGGGV